VKLKFKLSNYLLRCCDGRRLGQFDSHLVHAQHDCVCNYNKLESSLRHFVRMKLKFNKLNLSLRRKLSLMWKHEITVQQRFAKHEKVEHFRNAEFLENVQHLQMRAYVLSR
jgi:hypothetical protein